MTQRFVQHGPHHTHTHPHPQPLPAPLRLHKQLSHHVQISFLWLAGTPPPSPPSICSSCQLSNAFESGKDTHTHIHTRTSLTAMSGTPDCPTLTNMSEMKVTAWWRKEKAKKKRKKHLPCCLHDQSWSCLVWECSVSENRPPCHPWCARRISDRVCRWGNSQEF